MRVSLCVSLVFLSLLAVPTGLLAESSPPVAWNLPLVLNDSNTSVRFEVDTTWHMVHGVTSGITGRAWLADPKNHQSVHLEASLPVNKFDTDSESRDKEMREVMAEKSFPNVEIKIDAIDGLTSPTEVDAGQAAVGLARGSLTIRGVSRELRLPYRLTRESGKYIVSGELSFEWGAFGVEDPSIFIAKVHKTVTVRFTVTLPDKNRE